MRVWIERIFRVCMLALGLWALWQVRPYFEGENYAAATFWLVVGLAFCTMSHAHA
jgi:hypothetical protein